MTIGTRGVRGIYEFAEQRRVSVADMRYVVERALHVDGEAILNSEMEWAVDGQPTAFPLEKVGRRLQVEFEVVVVRED